MIKTPKRIHHTKRLQQKRKQDMIYHISTDIVSFDDKSFKMRLHTPTLCSCWLCGNPRKFYGNGKNSKTLQELKAINDEIYQDYQSIA